MGGGVNDATRQHKRPPGRIVYETGRTDPKKNQFYPPAARGTVRWEQRRIKSLAVDREQLADAIISPQCAARKVMCFVCRHPRLTQLRSAER
jgi:hypothetical protein